jgi:hypothetical protein
VVHHTAVGSRDSPRCARHAASRHHLGHVSSPGCRHPAQRPNTSPVSTGNRPNIQISFYNFPETIFHFPKFIYFEIQIQIVPNQSQSLSKFKFFISKILFISCNILKYVCLLVCMSRIKEPIFEEEPHIPDDPVDVVADLSEDEGKSH